MMLELLALVVLVAGLVWVGLPLLQERSETGEAGVSETRAALAARRHEVLEEISDLDLDYETGKLSEEDYRALRADARGRAAEVLQALDALPDPETGKQPDRPPEAPPGPKPRP